MSIQDSIRKISFFNNLNDEQIDLIASISNESTYTSNSILYYESDVNNNLLFLVEGLIKIYKVDKFDNEIFLYHIYKNSMITELTSIKHNDIYCFSNAPPRIPPKSIVSIELFFHSISFNCIICLI